MYTVSGDKASKTGRSYRNMHSKAVKEERRRREKDGHLQSQNDKVYIMYNK